MGGSGYDVACAAVNRPLVYRRNALSPIIQQVDFRPPFADQLYFVYLGNKQNSREGINKYRSVEKSRASAITAVNRLTHRFIQAQTLQELEDVIREHEALIGDFFEMECVKSRLFPDFWGEVKSLGAWGGDFILVSSSRDTAETEAYFVQKGFDKPIRFQDMIASDSTQNVLP